MPPLRTNSSEQIVELIEAAGESANIEAKGPIEWDGSGASAALTKDILALANCRDGGAIVIGKQESGPGKFSWIGLSDTQAASFETTKVATWVNNHCSPPVHLTCYRCDHKGRSYVVIVVSEFHEIPSVCTKQFEISGHGKTNNVLLRKGSVYVRTANAESAPLSTVDEMRQLIGLATTKRADQLLTMFQAMLQGRSLAVEKTDEELFRVERDQVGTDLADELGDEMSKGAWTFLAHPVRHIESRWEETEQLRSILERSVIRVRREFPPITYDMHVREWGVCNRHFEDAFGLTHSGLFLATRLFKENRLAFQRPWDSEPSLPPGKWTDHKLNLSPVIEFFMFLSRLGEHYEVGEELLYEVVAEPLRGRRLASMAPNIHLDPSEPCRATAFRRRKVISVESLRVSWEELSAKTLFGFYELFPGHRISQETLLSWVERFKERRFD